MEEGYWKYGENQFVGSLKQALGLAYTFTYPTTVPYII